MPQPDDDHGRPATIDPTTDLPSDAPPHAGPSTARRGDTSLRSDHLQTGNRTGEFVSDDPSQTGAYSPPTGQAEVSSVTGGYTPSDMPRPAVAGEPAVRGYEVLGELGRGGMGVVYKARQVGLDRLVALKMILAGAHARPKDLERFRAEAQAVARFQHPNIVQIYEVGESEGLPYFSLEFVDGGTLSGKIHREPQPPKYAAETVEALARAMQYAHDRGVVHRDLKPANVLLAADGTPKVTDFGLAKRLEQDSGQTQAGTVLGTPSYMAPEQAMGQVDLVGPPADVYALGAMLYDLLTGRPPFTGSSVLDTLEMVRTREPVPPGQLAAKLPRDLETICLKCLQKEPGKRYPSARDLADDLRRYLDGKPILARPVGPAERAWRWARRNPWLAGLGTATAVSILAVAVITSIMSYRLNERKKEAEANFLAAKIAEEKEAEEKRNALIARDKERKAKERSQEHQGYAYDMARSFTFIIDAELATKASLAPLRMRIQNKILADVDRVREKGEKNPLSDRGEAGPMTRIGDIYFHWNRVEDAAKQYKKVRAIFQQFVKDFPDDPIGPRNLAAISNKLADTELRLGDAAAARDLYAEALQHRQAWRAMLPNHDPAQESVAQSYDLLGRIHLELGDPAEALKSFQTSQAEYARLPKEVLAGLNTRRDLIEIRDRVAECLFKLGQTEKAEQEHRAAYKEREALVATYPQFPQLKRDLVFSRMSVGDLFLFRAKDAARALTEYAPGYQEFSRHAKADPDDLTAKREVSAMAYRMGFVTDRLADLNPAGSAALRVAARSFYQECLAARLDLAKADPRDTRGRIDVMVAQARLGRVAEVEKLAAGLRKDAGTDRRVLFQTACGLAIAAGETGPAAERCREEAFKVLGELVDRGWKDKVALETDPDLEAVRGDQRFAGLVARIRN